MHHQFKELADVDITAEPMEVGPTCHYVMGGVEVDPDTAAAARVPGLFAAGEVAGGMHGSNRLGGNSLSDLLVFGRRAGDRRRRLRRTGSGGTQPTARARRSSTAAERTALAPFDRSGGERAENPYTLHQELQQTMNDLVGIIRKAEEIEAALDKLGGAQGSGRPTSRSRATGSSTRAGTSPWTCATCSPSASAWPGPRCSGRSRAAATPATTSRRWSRSGAR